MTKPIEIIHQNFEIKLNIIQEILSVADNSTDAHIDFEAVRVDYRDQTLPLLCDYFDTEDAKTKCDIVARYMQILISRNFIARLNDIILKLRDATKANTDIKLHLQFKLYANTRVDTDIKRLDYKVCPECDAKMNVHPQHSELRCTKCPHTFRLKGTVFDESHLYTAEGGLAKRGAYETSRHCRYHLDRILAIKNPNLSDKVWAKIHAWLRRNNFKYLKLVTCVDYRRCLKDIKETHYNEHIPFIRQFIGGESPERLFHHEVRLLSIYFEKAVTAFNKIKGNERANLKYYPYFIFKIIEMILTKLNDKKRLRSIVNCIHFQRNNTIVANDRLWNDICDQIDDDEFVFKITDKNILYT
jgi:hypothetical protein